MIITEETKAIIEASAFISLVTIGPDENPHPIIAGKAEVAGDTVVFGIYKMEKTQRNLGLNKKAWLVAAEKDGKPRGIRLAGTAEARGKQLIFSAAQVDMLL
ncbi:MAG: pyridoxamine 5'-phosphate oxidase family protein [Spirochaetaceae bacterium]|jgi:hypothetical protein|nr:pyridoxamine 5'-phosphate oxidase family protein [Spirochaetaceae bacterium]